LYDVNNPYKRGRGEKEKEKEKEKRRKNPLPSHHMFSLSPFPLHQIEDT
jgi:hypothetical protein